jgi:UDP:flavonoid glycosyltransferase YjiC (YdhE family)
MYWNVIADFVRGQELEDFVSASDAGFIVFSVGSAIRMSDMPTDMLTSFINVFSGLAQNVIWQWNGAPKIRLPKNVKTLDWLPQQDLLGIWYE